MNKKDKIEVRKAIFDMHNVFIICYFIISYIVINYVKFKFLRQNIEIFKNIVI